MNSIAHSINPFVCLASILLLNATLAAVSTSNDATTTAVEEAPGPMVTNPASSVYNTKDYYEGTRIPKTYTKNITVGYLMNRSLQFIGGALAYSLENVSSIRFLFS